MSVVKKHRLNQEISIPNVRLINAEGENIGVVDIARAHEIAQEAGYDLVEIVPNAKPPVCRVMDYGKYRFELNKKAQIARKKQKQVQVKEIKFRPGTEKGDYDVKLRKLVSFLKEGDKTKVTIRFRGREMVHKSRGAELLDRVEADLQEISTVEQRPRMEGRQMIMVFAPKKKR